MGDPRKHRRKYERPKHPWKAERITEENELCRKYGLCNKREVWNAKSMVRGFRKQARRLLGSAGEEAQKESKELLDKLHRLGIMDSPNLEDVLTLTVEDVLKRRLQTIVCGRGIANTPKQARQFITHKHVYVGGNLVGVPSYIVGRDEEDQVRLAADIKVEQSERRKPEETGEAGAAGA